MATESTTVGAASSSHNDCPSPNAIHLVLRFESSTCFPVSGSLVEPTAMLTVAGFLHPPEILVEEFQHKTD